MTLCNARHNEAQIVRETGFTRDVVRRWMLAADSGRDASDKPRSGAPPKLTPPVVRMVRAHMKGKRGRSSRKVAKIIEARHRIQLSSTSVWRAARQAGLKPYTRPPKPLLTAANRQRRLDFVRLYRGTDWRKVLFSDEKTFELFGHPNRRNDRIWEESSENVPPSLTVKHPAKVHVWGAMSYYGKPELYLFEENLDRHLYVTILERRLAGIDGMFPRGVWMFQQDNDPKHTSKKARAWLDANVPAYIPKEHWPPNSPDLNLQEPLWSILQDRVYAREPRTLAGLKRIIREEWDRIELDTLRKLVDSMPRRLDAVEAANGGNTKY
jgi:transposase